MHEIHGYLKTAPTGESWCYCGRYWPCPTIKTETQKILDMSITGMLGDLTDRVIRLENLSEREDKRNLFHYGKEAALRQRIEDMEKAQILVEKVLKEQQKKINALLELSVLRTGPYKGDE